MGRRSFWCCGCLAVLVVAVWLLLPLAGALGLPWLCPFLLPAWQALESLARFGIALAWLLFVEAVPLVLAVWVLVFSLAGLVFGTGYTLAPKRRVAGTLLYGGALFLLAGLLLFLMLYGLAALAFSPWLHPHVRPLVLVGYGAGVLLPFLVVLEAFYDISCWYRDLLRERGQYGLLSYTVEREGRLTYVHIDTSKCRPGCVLRIAPILVFEQALWENEEPPLRSPARFFKGAVFTLLCEFVTHLTAWPRARRALFRLTGARIGKDCHIALWSRLDPMLPDLIELEDDSGVGIGCTLLTHSIIDTGSRLTFYYGPIKLCRWSRVGANATVMPGVTIGEGAVVGAGAVVTQDIPPWTIAAGVPAKVIGRRTPPRLDASQEPAG